MGPSSVAHLPVPGIDSRARIGNFGGGARSPSDAPASWLDSGDCAAFTIDDRERLLETNASARAVLERGDPLRSNDGALRARDPDSQRRLVAALRALRSDGLARYCMISGHGGTRALALLPVDGARGALLRLERPVIRDRATIDAFAASVGLTPTEARILGLLAQGRAPKEICALFDTAQSTVRTQIKSLLAKTGHHGIRPLLLRLMRLPGLD